jgi:hypothetical protein
MTPGHTANRSPSQHLRFVIKFGHADHRAKHLALNNGVVLFCPASRVGWK